MVNSVRNSRRPFEKWNSKEGRKFLDRVFSRETSLADVQEELHPPHWEGELVYQGLRRYIRKYRGSASALQRRRTVGDLAKELDIFRMGDPPTEDILRRLENPSFKGKRAHLIRLFAFLDMSEEWDRWRRRTEEVPDLRSASLSELDLRDIDLSRAHLRGADLCAAVIRGGNLQHADLRYCWLRHTDLSYADLRSAKLFGANLSHAMLTEADLRRADLRRSFLIGTSLNQAHIEGADLRGAVIWGISTWSIQYDNRTRQNGLLVVPTLEPLDYIDPEQCAKDYRTLRHAESSMRINDIEVAHFVSLLIENPMIGRVINAAAGRIVLLLGRFVGRERKVLDALTKRLPSFGYVPVVFDFAEPENRDTIETVAILAGLSNFVIANLSRPRSTPLEAHLIIPAIAVPFVPIVRETERPFAMFTALQRKYPWVLPTVRYRNEENLLRKLRKRVIEPAERKAAALRRSKHPREESDR